MAISVANETEPVTVLCPECGELIEIKDVAALIKTLHQMNICTVRHLLGKGDGEDR